MAVWPILIIGALLAAVGSPVYQQLKVVGVWRPRGSFTNVHGHDLKLIPAPQCEDVHWHQPSNLLYAACADDLPEKRFGWFPPLPILKDPSQAQQGSIFIIDPETLVVKKLKLSGFSGPFITHGIEVVSSGIPNIVNIFAVNHPPNPNYDSADSRSEKALSRIEFFRYTIGSDEAEYMRSIIHPLIRTPNDIVAVHPTSIYVTNDAYYRDGLLRHFEITLPSIFASWSDVVHIDIHDLKSTVPTDGVDVTVALPRYHYPNGLSRASKERPDEVLVTDFSGGLLTRAKANLNKGASPKLEVIEHIQLDYPADNPSYYEDPYATTANNASGYVLAGLGRILDLNPDVLADPESDVAPVVWHLRSNGSPSQSHKNWERRLIFQDNGKTLKGTTTAVMLPIDPVKNGGKKQGLLFVTSIFAMSMVVTKVDL